MRGDHLFAIDVASEIRSLCEAQLRGSWQMPAEIVRFAIQGGAEEVVASVGWRDVVLSWSGDPVELTTLEKLANALDSRSTPVSRQRAVAELESEGAEVLLWAGGVAGSRLRIESRGGGGRARFECRSGRAPRFETAGFIGSPCETVVRWRCPRFDRRRARQWLRMACRFAAARVVVDGHSVSRGFVGGLYRLRLTEPLPMELGLTRQGEEPVLWLMRNGVVAARAVLPGYPPFEAAVELGGVVSGGASSSDLRRAVTPYLSDLSDKAVWMMIQVVDRPDRLSGSVGQRLLDLLLRAARHGLREHEIRNLPMIPTCGGLKLVSIARVEALARRRGGRLFAIEPGVTVEGLLADPGSTVVASTGVRNLLSELTGIRFQPPPRRQAGPLRRFAERTRRRARWLAERSRGTIGGRALPLQALSRDERRLLGSLRAVLAPRSVDLGEGSGLRRTATGFVLPRSDPAVEAAVRVGAEDPSWLYPLVLSLRLGEPPPGSLRNRWTGLVWRSPG